MRRPRVLKIVAIEASLVAEAYALAREVFVVGFRESLSRTMMTNARPSCRDIRRVKIAWDLSCAEATFGPLGENHISTRRQEIDLQSPEHCMKSRNGR